MKRRLERRHLTQTGDRDDHKPRVFADYGHISVDSTLLLVAAKDRRTGMVFCCSRLDEGWCDIRTPRLLAKWIDGLECQEVTIRSNLEPSICELVRRARELCEEGATTVDEVSQPGDSSSHKGHPDNWLRLLVVPPACVSWRGWCAMLPRYSTLAQLVQMGTLCFDVCRDASSARGSLGFVSECGCGKRHWRR